MRKPTRITLRTADASQASKLHALISANLEEGRLLPREPGDLTLHAARFVVAMRGRTIAGCADLVPLSPHVAEVRSLAVDAKTRGSRHWRDARRGTAPARAPGRIRQALRVHAQAGLLQPDGVLDRPAPLAAGEDLHRLREMPAVPQVWAVRDVAAARCLLVRGGRS